MKLRNLSNCAAIGAFSPSFRDAATAPSGRILSLANDANFDSSHLSQPLTEFAAGVIDRSNLQELLATLAPDVPVGRRFDYFVHNEQADFADDSEDNADVRAIGGEFGTVKGEGKLMTGSTLNKGLTVVLDNDQGGTNPTVQQRWVRSITNRLLRTEIMRARILLDNAANDTAVNWGLATAAPDVDITEACDRSGDARGINANTIVIGGGAELKRYRRLAGSNNAGSYMGITLDDAQRKAIYGVDNVVRVNARRAGKASKNKVKVVGDAVYAFYSLPDATVSDPSNIKRFVSPTDQGGNIAIYIEQVMKRTRITVEHYSSIAITSSLGIEKLTVSYDEA